ncbi:biotin--[acetyl-CoA-carboxylase] ligase [Deinococcus altitudinis]|uniref:biotin--[acetyl-CoA-carboxylase] ligase n=1 Tax=Deinococcus altitudinis TaxID=468914 RepID=UPI0038920CA3
MTTLGRLLPLLTETPQSGERLARLLGVGRVSVNTLAHALRQEGYPLVVSRRGYALQAGTPAPWLVPELAGRPYRYLGSTTSTQNELRAWAADPHSPAPAGAVVLAEHQTAGRGRRGRVWEDRGAQADTAPDTARNLTFSLLLPPQPELNRLSLLPLAAGVALAQATQALAGVGGLKWPNDLLGPDGRKLAGILLEADLRGEEVTRAVLGIGLNVGSGPAGAAWLHEFAPGLRRDVVLLALLSSLNEWLAAPAEQILAAWREASVTLGQQVQVQTQAGTVTGQARDIGPDGALLVQTGSGELHRVTAGDVQLVGQLTAT